MKIRDLSERPGTPLPFWARIEDSSTELNGIPLTEEWGIIYFYVKDPSVIPEDFNLMSFFDFRALGVDFAVQGSSWWEEGNQMAPYVSKLEENGPVPFWIITSDQAKQAAKDGIITMVELRDLNPIKGYANDFFEILRPFGGGAPVNGILTNASGQLENNKTFNFLFRTKVPGGDIEKGTMRVEFFLN